MFFPGKAHPSRQGKGGHASPSPEFILRDHREKIRYLRCLRDDYQKNCHPDQFVLYGHAVGKGLKRDPKKARGHFIGGNLWAHGRLTCARGRG